MTPVCRKVRFEGDPEVLRKCLKSRKGVQPFKTSRVQRCEPALSVLLGFCTVPAHSQNGMKCARWRLALYERLSGHAAFVSAPRVGCGKKTTKIIWGDEHPLGTQLVAPSLGCFSPRGCFFVSHGDINVDCHPHMVYLSVQSTMKTICRSE